MRVDTRFGTLILPRTECARCFAKWQFFLCTSCDAVQGIMMDCASYTHNGMGDIGALMRIGELHLTNEGQDETRSDDDDEN